MGNLCCAKRQKRKKIVLLLLGLDNAGKTVAAKNLARETPFTNSVIPTIGFSVVELKYEKYDVKIYDLGGRSDIRGIWENYYTDAYGVIFVIDSSDHSRLDEAESVLKEIVRHPKVMGKPLLLLANKQDNENALDEIDIIERLDIEQLVNRYECPTLVESCAASEQHEHFKLDAGIKRGYSWLIKFIAREYDALHKRVQYDMEIQKQLEFEAREEKRRRLKALNDSEAKLHENVLQMNEISHKNDLILRIPLHQHTNDAYIATIEDAFVPNMQRPKSATNVVRKQLEFDASHKRSLPFRCFSATNRTAPVHLFEKQQQSNGDAMVERTKDRRLLKSAGDSIFVLAKFRQPIQPIRMDGSGDLQIVDYDYANVSTTIANKGGDLQQQHHNGVHDTTTPF